MLRLAQLVIGFVIVNTLFVGEDLHASFRINQFIAHVNGIYDVMKNIYFAGLLVLLIFRLFGIGLPRKGGRTPTWSGKCN